MRVCATPGCPKLVPADAYRGLCDTHRKQRDKARGTKAERGYGREFTQTRRSWANKISNGERVTCWRCGQPISAGSTWHLGHDDNDRSIIRGPEHADCNLIAAGRASHRN